MEIKLVSVIPGFHSEECVSLDCDLWGLTIIHQSQFELQLKERLRSEGANFSILIFMFLFFRSLTLEPLANAHSGKEMISDAICHVIMDITF